MQVKVRTWFSRQPFHPPRKFFQGEQLAENPRMLAYLVASPIEFLGTTLSVFSIYQQPLEEYSFDLKGAREGTELSNL